jgi:hypothetical protein
MKAANSETNGEVKKVSLGACVKDGEMGVGGTGVLAVLGHHLLCKVKGPGVLAVNLEKGCESAEHIAQGGRLVPSLLKVSQIPNAVQRTMSLSSSISSSVALSVRMWSTLEMNTAMLLLLLNSNTILPMVGDSLCECIRE